MDLYIKPNGFLAKYAEKYEKLNMPFSSPRAKLFLPVFF